MNLKNTIAKTGRSIAFSLMAMFAAFFIMLLTVVFFDETVKKWDTKNAFPVFVAACVGCFAGNTIGKAVKKM